MSNLREKYLENIQDSYEEALDLSYIKSADYTKESDPFQNFREAAAFAGVTVEQGILYHIGNKIVRYKNLSAKDDLYGAVGEAFTDTLLDALNYLAILKTWHDLKKPAPGTTWAEQVELPLEPDVDAELEDYVSEIASSTGNTGTKDTNWFIEFIAKKIDERNASKK